MVTARASAGCRIHANFAGWENRSTPIGNGWFGVSVFGGVADEWLQITHNALYAASYEAA